MGFCPHTLRGHTSSHWKDGDLFSEIWDASDSRTIRLGWSGSQPTEEVFTPWEVLFRVLTFLMSDALFHPVPVA